MTDQPVDASPEITAEKPAVSPGTDQGPTRPPAAPAVRIIGRGDGVVIQVESQQAEWTQIVEMLSAHLSHANGFFRGERVSLELGDRAVEQEQFQQLLQLLTEQEVSLKSLRTGDADVQKMAEGLGVTVQLNPKGEAQPTANYSSIQSTANWEVILSGKQSAPWSVVADFQMPAAITDTIVQVIQEEGINPALRPEEDETDFAPAVHSTVISHPDDPDLLQRISAPPYLYRGTLRSGQVFRHAGHVMVMGDVNPGAQVVSGGDIYVWGRLRGIVHAGAMGDESAMIAALDFEPVQVRIAAQIAMSPRGNASDPGRWFWNRQPSGKPEIARVLKGRIVVDHWDARWPTRTIRLK